MNTHLLPAGGWTGATRKELGRYSLAELIDAAAHMDHNRLAPYRAFSGSIERAVERPPSTVSSFYIPNEYITRDLTAASAPGGGYLVGTATSFASGLFSGLLGALPTAKIAAKGNQTIGVGGSFSTVWLANEASSSAATDPTFGSRALSPKTVGVSTFYSRNFALQAGPEGTASVEQQLGAKCQEAAATALINGSGAGQPTGLLLASGTTSTSGTSLAWSGIRDLLAAAEGYTVGDLIFVLGVTTAKLLRAREKAAGNGMVLADGRIDGYPAIVSRCVPADALVLAPWATVVMATWGALELTVTPLATPAAFQTGKIGVRLLWTLDFAPQQPSVVGISTAIT